MHRTVAGRSLAALAVALTAVTIATAATAGPISITVESAAADVKALTAGGSFGPPAPATFPDGPFTVASGIAATLSAGPGSPAGSKKHPIAVNSVLLVLSGDASALGSKTISLSFGSLGTVNFGASDFFSTAADGFPASIGGIANGAVNGIKFPTSEHAAADILFNAGITKGDVLGDVTVVSPIDLRIDVFGDASGSIIGNAANSGAEGVLACTDRCGTPPQPHVNTPEPASIGLLSVGLLGLLAMQRRNHPTRS